MIINKGIGFSLYLITDGQTYPEDRLTQALSTIPPGSAAVQLRNKALSQDHCRAFFRLAERLRRLTLPHAAPLFINDRIDVALAVGADGVHLPGHGHPPELVRQSFPARLLLSAAAHSLAEAQALFAGGADCVTLSPIWPTPSKLQDPALPADRQVKPLGLSALAAACEKLAAPVFALGGVDTPARAAACAQAGARIACLRGVLGQEDPAAAALAMLAAFDAYGCARS